MLIPWLHWRKNNKVTVAIDIGTTTVTLLERSTAQALHIRAIAKEPLRACGIEGYTIKDVEMLGAAIRKAAMQANITGKQAILAVPDAAAISTILKVSSELNEKEIEEFIGFEAEKIFPYALEEINLDFQLLDLVPHNEKQREVLVVGARREIVNSRVEAAQLAGFDVQIVDIVSHAIVRGMSNFIHQTPELNTDSHKALCYLGEEETHFFIIHNNRVTFSRTEEFGSRQLFETTMHNYSVSMEAAQQMIADKDVPPDYDEIVLLPFIESLLLQLRRTLQFYFSSDHQEKFQQIVFAGILTQLNTISRQGDLAQFIAEKMGLTVFFMDPLNTISIAHDLKKSPLLKQPYDFLVAAGLLRWGDKI